MTSESERAKFETSVRLEDARLLAYARAETTRAAKIESDLAELGESYAVAESDVTEQAKDAIRALFGIAYAPKRVGYGVPESEWTETREASEREVARGIAELVSDLKDYFKGADDELYD